MSAVCFIWNSCDEEKDDSWINLWLNLFELFSFSSQLRIHLIEIF
uniref:Uncharacterized protein n=1 Tax=Wuchereria bancrofti TaxID=6293 RepID=A0AAF5PGX9_WUCBA